jgi:hypothetical protein
VCGPPKLSSPPSLPTSLACHFGEISLHSSRTGSRACITTSTRHSLLHNHEHIHLAVLSCTHTHTHTHRLSGAGRLGQLVAIGYFVLCGGQSSADDGGGGWLATCPVDIHTRICLLSRLIFLCAALSHAFVRIVNGTYRAQGPILAYVKAIRFTLTACALVTPQQ